VFATVGILLSLSLHKLPFVQLIAAQFIKSQNSLYYVIVAASSVVFLLPYLLMLPATVVLRIKDPDRPRPYRIPRTEIQHRPADWSYTGQLLGIVAGALIILEVLIWSGVRRSRTAKPPKAPTPPAPALPSHP
jgi:amino acid transporter